MKNKLKQTQDTIHCWVEAWGGPENVYVAFSGGKDSTVLLHIARTLYPNIVAVFSNTGLEFPEIIKFVRTFDNIVELRPRIPFHKVIERYGWPVVSKSVSMAISRYRNTKDPAVKQYRKHGRTVGGKKYTAGTIPKKWWYLIDSEFKISEQCCTHLKKNPFTSFERRTGLKPMLGIMASDSNMRLRDINSRGCNVYDTKKPQSRPLAHWSEKDIYDYIKEFDIPICSVYSLGYQRTGCVFCMYGLYQEQEKAGINRFQLMKKTHPQLYNYCINKLGAKEVLDFMKIPY